MRGDRERKAFERRLAIADGIALAAVLRRPFGDILSNDPHKDEPIGGIEDRQRGEAEGGEDEGTAAHGGAIL